MEEAPGGTPGPGPGEQGEMEETGRTLHIGGGGLTSKGGLSRALPDKLIFTPPTRMFIERPLLTGCSLGPCPEGLTPLGSLKAAALQTSPAVGAAGRRSFQGQGRGSPPIARAQGVCQLVWRPLGDLLQQDVGGQCNLW